MSMLWLLRKAPDHKPAIIRHAGIRWEVDEKAVPYVMSRKDWTFGTLRKECAGKMIKTKETRLVFTERILQEDVFIKALFFDRFNVRLRSLFGRCRTRKEWENHHIALSRGIPTIRPLRLGELKKGLLVHEAVLLLEGRVDLLNMNQWRRIKGRERDDGPSLELAYCLGRLTARTHLQGVYHNEIRPDNLLVDESLDGRILLVDWKHAYLRKHNVKNNVENLIRTDSLFERDMAFKPPSITEKKAFMQGYFGEISSCHKVYDEIFCAVKRTRPELV